MSATPLTLDAARLFTTALLVLFKEAIPAWLGFDNLHTVVSRPEVTAHDLLGMLSTPAGLVLVRNQAVMLIANLVVLVAVAWLVGILWRSARSIDVVQRQSSAEMVGPRC